jgi:Tfp pilus assembly protein PilN
MNEDLQALRQIDFLPDRFRNAKVKRHASVWRLALAVMFAAMLSAAAIYQWHLLRQARYELARVDQQHQSATALTKRLAEVQQQLVPLDKVAQLLAYLNSPWPKSQLVAAALADVPDSVVLHRLEIDFAKANEEPSTSLAANPETAAPATTGPSADRDFERLKQTYDRGRWMISVAGASSSLSELHVYLAKLEQQPLFATVELVSIEAAAAGTNQSKFVVRIFVKPPHGSGALSPHSAGMRTKFLEQNSCV